MSDRTGFLIGIQFVLIACLAGWVFYKFSECGCYNELKDRDGQRSGLGADGSGGGMLTVPRIDAGEYAKITGDVYTAAPPRDPIAFGKQDLRVYIDDEYLPKAIESFSGSELPKNPFFDITLNAEADPLEPDIMMKKFNMAKPTEP